MTKTITSKFTDAGFSGHREKLSQLEPWGAEYALGIWLVADGNMCTELDYQIQQSQVWHILWHQFGQQNS